MPASVLERRRTSIQVSNIRATSEHLRSTTARHLSGHLPLQPDGSLAEPFNKVGTDMTLGQGVAADRLTAPAAIGGLQRELGDFDRVVAWLRVFALVNTAPGPTQMAARRWRTAGC